MAWLADSLWPFAGPRTKTIDLRFSLPAMEPGVHAPQFYTGAFARELAELAAAPAEQLKLLRRAMRDLNRCKMGAGDRLDRNRQALGHFLPILQQELRRYSKAGGIPDSPLRRDVLDMSADILKLLGQSYMAVFKHHYERSDAAFAKAIVEARLCACRALELVRLEQRVRGLRYQPLSNATWAMANTLFLVLRQHDDVEAPVPLLEGDVYDSHKGRTTSVAEVFKALHITGHLDMLHWPIAFQAMLVGYLEGLMDTIVLLDDHGGPMHKELLSIQCHQSGPGSAQRMENPDSLPVVLMDWQALAKHIRSDCLAIVRASRGNDQQKVPRKLVLLSSIERLALAQLLLNSLNRPAPDDGSMDRDEKVLDMQIYVGFREVYLLIQHILSGRADSHGKRFIDHFAERSAMIAEDHTSEQQSLWYVLRQTNTMIRLKTQETEFSTALEVGSLVAYELGARDRHRPRLAVVRRIYRPSTAYVILDLERLAKYAEPVVVTALNGDQPEGDPMAAMLKFDPDHGCSLLFSPKYSVMDKTRVKMSFRGRDHVFTLGGLKFVTTGFYLFSVPLGMTALGLDAPPVFPEPAAPEEVPAAGAPR